MVALFGFPMLLSIPTSESSEPFFKDAGREGDWNTALSLGNPATSAEVKAYLKAFTSEQLHAAVTPKQTTPLFLIKIVPLSRLIQEKCYFLVLLLLSYLFMQETLLSLRRSFSVETGKTSLPWSRPKR